MSIQRTVLLPLVTAMHFLTPNIAAASSSNCHDWSTMGNPGISLPVQISEDSPSHVTVRNYQIVPLNEKVDDFLKQVQAAYRSGRPFPSVVCVKGTIGGKIVPGAPESGQQYFVYDIQVGDRNSDIKTFQGKRTAP